MIYNRLTRSYENMRNENEKSFAEEEEAKAERMVFNS